MIDIGRLKPTRFDEVDGIALWYPIAEGSRPHLMVGKQATGVVVHLTGAHQYHALQRAGATEALGLEVGDIHIEVDFSRMRTSNSAEQLGTLRLGARGPEVLLEAQQIEGRAVRWVPLTTQDPLASAVRHSHEGEHAYFDDWQIVTKSLQSGAIVWASRSDRAWRFPAQIG